MTIYERRAYYHETDQMGVIHHSNYLKWMEEARIQFMDELGFSYDKMEKLGVISPVASVALEYKKPVLFNETVCVYIKIEVYNGIRLELSYEIRNKETNDLCVLAKSKHCFIKDDKVISVKRELPEFHEKFLSFYENN